jgi:hypothetical protein
MLTFCSPLLLLLLLLLLWLWLLLTPCVRSISW